MWRAVEQNMEVYRKHWLRCGLRVAPVLLAACSAASERAPRADFVVDAQTPAMVEVVLPDGRLLVSATEVTQAQFELLMGYQPSWMRSTPDHPVESVTWHEAAMYANALSAAQGLELCYDLSSCSRPDVDGGAGRQRGQVTCTAAVASAEQSCTGYRLPTYEEFRAYSPWSLAGASRSERAAAAHTGYTYRSAARTLPVGSLQPNEFGLYDTYGNVAEWLNDGVTTRRSDDAHCIAGVCYLTSWNRVGPDNHTHMDAARNRSCTGFRVVRRLNVADG